MKHWVCYQARVSSDIPRLNAFCLVAPTVRFSALAIFGAGVFFLARPFKVRTFSAVHPFCCLLCHQIIPGCDEDEFVVERFREGKVKKEWESHLLISHVQFLRRKSKGSGCCGKRD